MTRHTLKLLIWVLFNKLTSAHFSAWWLLAAFLFVFTFFTRLCLLVRFWPFICPEPIDHRIVCEFGCLLGRIIDNYSTLGYQKLTSSLPQIQSLSGLLSSVPGSRHRMVTPARLCVPLLLASLHPVPLSLLPTPASISPSVSSHVSHCAIIVN